MRYAVCGIKCCISTGTTVHNIHTYQHNIPCDISISTSICIVGTCTGNMSNITYEHISTHKQIKTPFLYPFHVSTFRRICILQSASFMKDADWYKIMYVRRHVFGSQVPTFSSNSSCSFLAASELATSSICHLFVPVRDACTDFSRYTSL
jgi:hypothetical protein